MGCCILVGFPEGHTIQMTQEQYNGVNIYEENKKQPPKMLYGTQKLTTSDIISELDKIVDINPTILKYLSAIILSPFGYAMDRYAQIRYRSDGRAFATSLYHTREIIIFAVPENPKNTRNRLKKEHTLLHEIGHIIDGTHKEDDKMLSSSDKWKTAQEKDRERSDYGYYVSDNSRSLKSSKDDFADAFVMFVTESERFQTEYKNRYDILEKLNIYET